MCFALYLTNCISYHQDFDNNIYRCFSLYFFKKCSIVNIKILFLLAHFNRFFNNNLFFKFISKCQKEILRCAPPSHVCDFLLQSNFFISTNFQFHIFLWPFPLFGFPANFKGFFVFFPFYQFLGSPIPLNKGRGNYGMFAHFSTLCIKG